MKEEELVNPPWTNGNLDEWLYRPVKLRGRPIHRHEMQFRWKRSDGQNGSFVFVPLVTQEDEDFSPESRKGLILGLGWMPQLFENKTQRGRWEDSETYQEFIGYVTTNPELQNATTKAGNIYDQQLFDFSIVNVIKNHIIFQRWQSLQL